MKVDSNLIGWNWLNRIRTSMISTRYLFRKLKYDLGVLSKPKLYFVTPEANWILDWVAHCVVRELPSFGLDAQQVLFADKLVGQTYALCFSVGVGHQAFLEAQASGAIPVSTPVGLTPDLALDGKTGYLLGSNNLPELVSLFKALVDDAQLRRQMGIAGRRVIKAPLN